MIMFAWHRKIERVINNNGTDNSFPKSQDARQNNIREQFFLVHCVLNMSNELRKNQISTILFGYDGLIQKISNMV